MRLRLTFISSFIVRLASVQGLRYGNRSGVRHGEGLTPGGQVYDIHAASVRRHAGNAQKEALSKTGPVVDLLVQAERDQPWITAGKSHRESAKMLPLRDTRG